jgi:hypothetical protein
MTLSHRSLCVLYALIGLVALAGTWGNVLGMLPQYGFWGGTLKFWQDVLVNESSRFITVDILFLALAVTLWMLLEGRRLNLRFVWVYVLLGFFVGISFAVPMFFIHRQTRLAATEPGPAGRLAGVDLVLLLVSALGFLAYTGVALTR